MRAVRHFALIAAACASGSLAAATPVVTSPVPVLRAGQGANLAAPLRSPHPLARPALAAKSTAPDNNDLAQARPKPKPAAPLTAGQPEAEATGPALPDLAEASPPVRPRLLERLINVSAPAGASRPVPLESQPKSVGGLCGDPGLAGEMIAPIVATNSACGLEDGVRITSVSGVRLSQPATVDCPTARAFRGWVDADVKPAIGGMGGGLATIEIAGSYACRPRNNVRGNKMSEHGKGHAIDVSALILDNGNVISVLADWGRGREGRVLKAIRASACGPFTTVLGPGSDPYHRNHLHVDTARGRGPYCR